MIESSASRCGSRSRTRPSWSARSACPRSWKAWKTETRSARCLSMSPGAPFVGIFRRPTNRSARSRTGSACRISAGARQTIRAGARMVGFGVTGRSSCRADRQECPTSRRSHSAKPTLVGHSALDFCFLDADGPLFRQLSTNSSRSPNYGRVSPMIRSAADETLARAVTSDPFGLPGDRACLAMRRA